LYFLRNVKKHKRKRKVASLLRFNAVRDESLAQHILNPEAEGDGTFILYIHPF
jgi:hypothetical protein